MTEKAALCQVTIIPEKRAGMGSRLINAAAISAIAKPATPLINVSASPSPKNCHWMFLGSLPHCNQHDVHDTDASQHERHNADGPEELIHTNNDVVHHNGFQRRVPDRDRFIILMLEIVPIAKNGANFIFKRTTLNKIDLPSRRHGA